MVLRIVERSEMSEKQALERLIEEIQKLKSSKHVSDNDRKSRVNDTLERLERLSSENDGKRSACQ
jgi:hypothetical protein